MTRWLAPGPAAWLGAFAGGAGGGLLLWLDDVRDHDPAWTVLASALLLVAVQATWWALRVRPGWVGVGGYALSLIGVGVAFVALLGTVAARDSSATGEIVAVALPIAVVGHVLFTLAIAFRQEFAALSTLAFVAAGVMFVVTAAWRPAYAVAWLCWAGALGVQAVFAGLGRSAVRPAGQRAAS